MGESKKRARGGIRWGSVVEKVLKDVGANQEGIMSPDKSCRYKTKAEETMRVERREMLLIALRNEVKSEEHLGDIREVKRSDRNKKLFGQPTHWTSRKR